MLHMALLLLSAIGAGEPAPGGAVPLPDRLSDTGLYEPGTHVVRAQNLPFTPQYPLWSDGAAKRRWLYLPPGSAIDASNAFAWEFPRGTRLWKEFSHGRAVETRIIERLPDGTWRYAAYVWNEDGSDALLAGSDGIAALPVETAPGGRYRIPSQDDCRACHEGQNVPVLGVSALQLSPERDPNVVRVDTPGANDVDLRELVARGLVVNLPPHLLLEPPRIKAASATERTALGYLHVNCGHCHNDDGPLALLEMTLAQDSPQAAAAVRASLVDRTSDFDMHGTDQRVVAGEPDASVLVLRMRSRDALAQMPPLGTDYADADGIALIEQWIRNDLLLHKEQKQ